MITSSHSRRIVSRVNADQNFVRLFCVLFVVRPMSIWTCNLLSHLTFVSTPPLSLVVPWLCSIYRPFFFPSDPHLCYSGQRSLCSSFQSLHLYPPTEPTHFRLLVPSLPSPVHSLEPPVTSACLLTVVELLVWKHAWVRVLSFYFCSTVRYVDIGEFGSLWFVCILDVWNR